jgi:hypothetical protein
VGFSRIGEYGPRVPIIVLLMDQHDRPSDHPQSLPDVEQTEDDDIGEISEFDLERDQEKAYEALEAAVDIWEAIDQELPSEDLPLGHP